MSEDLDVVKELLGKTIRIELSDGRVVEGEFQVRTLWSYLSNFAFDVFFLSVSGPRVQLRARVCSGVPRPGVR